MTMGVVRLRSVSQMSGPKAVIYSAVIVRIEVGLSVGMADGLRFLGRPQFKHCNPARWAMWPL